MRIVPNSTVNLYSGVQIDHNEQLIFRNATAQRAYFETKLVAQQVNCQMVKKTGRLRLDKAGSVVASCNYLSFVNPDFDNKIVYARIIDYDYVNNECVEISYVIDFWQTWMFDVTFDDMYIEREHLSETDFLKAETNPYDPSIYEFRTAETLPIGPEVEKLNYTLGSSDTTDGMYLRKAIQDFANVSDDTCVLIYLAEIDFQDLDDSAEAGATLPSDWYASMLYHTATSTANTYGFYSLTDAQYNYLHGLYPNAVTSKKEVGSGWSGLNIEPMNSNAIEAGYNAIYTTPMWASDLFKHLTQWNCVSAIIGMYGLPNDLIVMNGLSSNTPGSQGTFYVRQKTAKTKQTVHNKKLMLYPYSYLRLYAPNGDLKELRYESFADVQNGLDQCQIDFNLDLMEKPTLIVAPDNYKMSGLSPATSAINANLFEGLIFNQFPTMPYTIDSFLAQMASVAANIIGNNTTEYGYSLEQKQLDVYKSGAQTAAEVAGAANSALHLDFGGAVSKGVNATFGATQTELMSKQLQNEAGMSQDAYALLAGEQEGNAVFENFKYTRAAYAANKYTPSNGDGTINYNVMSMFDIIVLRVALNPTVLAQYDKWFTQYGYSSGRCGIPRVLNYINFQDGNQDDRVNWETINGKQCTYIKTSDCKVTYSMLPVAQYIKAMFDGGIRLIKGDLT